MRYDAPYLVKRYAPMIGRPESPKRITVAFQAYTLTAALDFARLERSPTPWRRSGPLWIEHRGHSAVRKKRLSSDAAMKEQLG